MTTRNQAKAFVLHRLLTESHCAFVYIDSRKSNVWVPKFCRNKEQLVLQLGMNLPVPMQDFKMSPRGWTAILSFNRQLYTCSIPWEAIYLIVNEDGMGAVWVEDAPPSVDIPGRQAHISGAHIEDGYIGDAHLGGATLDGAHPPTHTSTPVRREETRKTLPPSWRVIEGGKSDARSDRPKAG